jgi:hypothetical protein
MSEAHENESPLMEGVRGLERALWALGDGGLRELVPYESEILGREFVGLADRLEAFQSDLGPRQHGRVLASATLELEALLFRLEALVEKIQCLGLWLIGGGKSAPPVTVASVLLQFEVLFEPNIWLSVTSKTHAAWPAPSERPRGAQVAYRQFVGSWTVLLPAVKEAVLTLQADLELARARHGPRLWGPEGSPHRGIATSPT